jgi:hypothetical protein
LPTTIKGLFTHFAAHVWSGPVHWGESPCCHEHGIYVVALPAPVLAIPVNTVALTYWVANAGRMTVNRVRADTITLSAALAAFWHSDETILYVCRAGSASPLPTRSTISDRVMAYFSTRLGAHRPHRGGYWTKVLSCLRSLLVYWAPTTDLAYTDFGRHGNLGQLAKRNQ